MSKSKTRREALTAGGAIAIAATAGAVIPAIASTEGDDAKLIALGRQLEASWSREQPVYAAYNRVDDDPGATGADLLAAEEAWQTAANESSEIGVRIFDTPAHTLEGMKVKLRAADILGLHLDPSDDYLIGTLDGWAQSIAADVRAMVARAAT
jgi:hypothetical protein